MDLKKDFQMLIQLFAGLINIFFIITMYFSDAMCKEVEHEYKLRKRGSVLNKNNKWR